MTHTLKFVLGGLLACAAVVAAFLAYHSLRPGPAEKASVVEALRRGPGVVRVEEPVMVARSARRIVHLLDYRLVPRELHGEEGYAAHLARVEAVQQEHVGLLRWLAANQGVGEVFVEGLTEESLPAFFEKARAAAEMGAVEIPRLLDQLADARARRTGQDRPLETALAALTDDHRERLLSLGGAGRLFMVGVLDVRPLDDAAPLEWARPRVVAGRVVVNPRAAKARADAMVRNALRGEGPVVVVLLGAGHDLTDSIEEQDPHCGYVRVTTRKVAELFGRVR